MNAHFIDDSFLPGDTVKECRANVIDTVTISTDVGFVVHFGKYVLEPVQQLPYLGFILDSLSMTVYLTQEKADKLSQTCKDTLKQNRISIRDLAQLVGRMVGSFPGVECGKLYYRLLDNEKTAALTVSKGNFEAVMTLSDIAKQDIQWWIHNIHSCHGNPDIVLQSDASNKGWGGVLYEQSTGGHWSDVEATTTSAIWNFWLIG